MINLFQIPQQSNIKRRDRRELFAGELLAVRLKHEQIGEELQRDAVVDAVECERISAQLVVNDREGGFFLEQVDAIDLAVQHDLFAVGRRKRVRGKLRSFSAEGELGVRGTKSP